MCVYNNFMRKFNYDYPPVSHVDFTKNKLCKQIQYYAGKMRDIIVESQCV